jgi:ribosomal protein L12E/L44/L45/RPP1/RPP2
MNKHIELVKKWLAESDSVSYQELRDNVDSAHLDYVYALLDDDLDEVAATSCAAKAADAAADAAAVDTSATAAAAVAYAAAHWVKEYEIVEIGRTK